MIWNILVLFSHILNVLTGGSMYEPFSARCYKEGLKYEKWVNSLFFWEKEHCKNAYDNNMKQIIEFIN